MSEKDYICLSDSKPLDEDEVRICSDCGKKTCSVCGGDVATIEEYDLVIKLNSER